MCGKTFEKRRLKSGRISKSECCSEECTFNLKSIRSKEIISKAISEGKHKGWASRNVISYPERFFINVLRNNGIKYEHNFPIKQKDLGIDNDYNFFLDFYIENKKIDLEIDGKQHKYRKEHDDNRDDLLKNNGYHVYRIKWKNINNDKGKKYIKEEIEIFLKYYNTL